MKDNTNISKVIRESLRPSTTNIKARDNVIDLLPELYEDEKFEAKSRKGTWIIYKRKNYVFPYFLEKK